MPWLRLKKKYIDFGDSTVLSIIDHLSQKTAIKMTTAQKHEYKATGYNNPWETTSITAYFMQLDRFQVSLGNRGIATSDAEKTMAAGAQMWQREMFTEDQMATWESKTATQQTWAELQTYFTEKWLEHKQYSARRAKQLQFKEAALLAQETVAAAQDEGKSQAMLFPMLQEQHDGQIAAITATNKANMDAMMERMNALLAGGVGRHPSHQDKESTPIVGNSLPTSTRSDTTQPKKPKRCKSICPHCKMFVLCKPKNCVELDANKVKCWPG
jgi:hypothetical protein